MAESDKKELPRLIRIKPKLQLKQLLKEVIVLFCFFPEWLCFFVETNLKRQEELSELFAISWVSAYIGDILKGDMIFNKVSNRNTIFLS